MTYKIKKEKKDKGILELNVTMAFAEVEKNKDKAVKYLSENTEIEGFRKGKIPKDILESKLGEGKILQEAAQQTINEIFSKILQEEKIRMIGYPSISVVKLAPDNDFEFRVLLTTYPDVVLPDYKKIASLVKKEKLKVTKEEVAKVEQNLLDMQNNMHQHDHKEGEKCDHKVETELTDDFVKKLGPFKDVSEFNKKMEEDLKVQKEQESIGQHREKIVSMIIEKIDLSVPEILVNAEIDKIIAQMKDDVIKNGMEWAAYLKSSNKNEIQVREEYKPEAVKRAKAEIVLKEIAKVEKLSADKKDLEKQIEAIKKMYPDTEVENIRLYVENILINEAVMKFLEK